MEFNITKKDLEFWKKLDSKCDDEIIRKEITRIRKEAQKELVQKIDKYLEGCDDLNDLFKDWDKFKKTIK